LNWQPTIDMEQTVADTLDFFLRTVVSAENKG